ncbi:MAG: TAXI family TRAP transporter solute-binding subunit [Ruminococcaceae bacterium]|nr:TAXI family TRAP transporter solute-binding subunit [Oscillospiraceae bacterium]
MKKLLLLILALLTACSVLLSGCYLSLSNVDNDRDDSDEDEEDERGEALIVATGGNSGTYYAYGMAMAHVISDETGIELDVQSTGASKANIQLIRAGEADVAMVQNDVMYYAYTGINHFDGEMYRGFSVLATLYPELVQIVARKDSGITTVSDLAGKRVSVGDAGSGTELNAKHILGACGIDIENDIEKYNFDFGKSADALKEGTVDAFFCVAGIPTTAITELAISHEIVVVSVDDYVYNNLYDDYQFYTQQTIPAGTYKGVDKDIKTVAVMATYIVDNDLDEETVYEFTKALFEKKDDIADAHAKGDELDVETAINGIPEEVPIHPGAEKYYKEAGIIR